LPVSFIVVASLVVAIAVGIVMALAVRVGLHLASCSHLALRFALIIPGASLLIVGILASWPVETHAIKLDMPSGRTSPISPPLTFWLFIVAAILVPVVVSYTIGRLARAKQIPPPNHSLERTREG
jgi:membrane protease YdiL (CAAX protease family)